MNKGPMPPTLQENGQALPNDHGYGVFLEKTIRGAGSLLRSVLDSGNMVGSWCDVMMSRFIIKAIADRYPEHGYITEEEGSVDKGRDAFTWIIDPIDGSENFYRGILSYSVSISLMRRGQVLIGAVYEPYVDRLFYGENGKGAVLNGQAIHVSETSSICEAVVAISRHKSFLCSKSNQSLVFQRLVEGLNVRISASTALDMCYVAMGAIEGRVMANTRIWDNSAATLIVREAGGMVTDWKGQLPKHEARALLASNGLCHFELLNFLGSVSK